MKKLRNECDLAKFKHPEKRYYPNVFWFWNGKMSKKTMKKQLREMRKRGIMQPIIVPLEGLTIEYLSNEWFEKVRCACKMAKELGMTLLLYDEFNWPSGYAGGKLLKANPRYRAKCFAMSEMEVQGPVHYSTSVPRGFSQAVVMGKVNPDLLGNLIDLTDQVKNNEISYDVPPGRWKLMFFGIKMGNYQPPFSNSYYGDLLNPKGVKKFISLTHERYYERMPEYFGSVIKGFFTDEPGLYFNVWWFNPASIPWTPNLFDTFRKRKGYDLRRYLPALWYGLSDKDKTIKVRVDFFDVIATLYQNSYFKALHDWCAAHNISFMGHILSEEDLRFIVRLEADYFKAMRYVETPGVDDISSWDKKSITPKLGSSVAHAFGRPTVFSETFALYGWGLTLELMKGVTDWQFVRGINRQLISAFFYSVEGKRRYRIPPSMYQNTFWPYFHSYTDYTARLSYMLTHGRHIAPIAVLLPMVTAQSTITALDLSEVSKLQTLLENISNFLLENQYDFDYLDESLFDEVSVTRGSHSFPRLRLGNENYSVLILPGNKVISQTTLKKIMEFKKAGGTVVALGDPPKTLSDGTCIDKDFPLLKIDQLPEVLGKFRDMEILNPEGKKFEVYDEIVRGGHVNEGYAAPLSEGHELGLLFDVDGDCFDRVCCDVATGEWVEGPGEVSAGRAKAESPNVTLVLRKDGPYGKAMVSKRFELITTPRLILEFKPLPRGKYYLQMKDPEGNVRWWSRDFNEDNRTVAYADGKRVSGHDRTLYLRQINHTTKTPFINYLHRVRDNRHIYFITNSAPLDVDLFVAFQATGTPELWDPSGRRETPHEFRREDNKTIIHLRLSRFGSIFVVFSKWKNTPHITATNMWIKRVRTQTDRVIVNATALQAGKNFVEVEWMDKKCFSQVRAKGPEMIKIKEWNFSAGEYKRKLDGRWSDGLPYFSGTGIYSQELSVPDSMLKNRTIMLDCQEVASIMKLEINGKEVGNRCWHPYKFDITSYLKPGKNKIVIQVTNTPANNIDHVALPSGLLTPVQILVYENYVMSPLP